MTERPDASDPIASGPIGEDDLQAYIDGRLADDRRVRVEAYLAAQPQVAERVRSEQHQRALLRDQLQAKADEPIPARLRVATLMAARRSRLRARLRTVAAAAVLFVAGAGSGWLVTELTGGPAADGSLPPTAVVTRDAVAAYRTFVVEVAHPVEVAAAQEDHLLQWLSKRVGRPLAAPSLTQFGYRLVGGRVLPAEAGAAAQLMYEDDAGRRLMLYVQAADGTETAFRFQADGDAATFAWIDRGFGFAVTAPLDRAALLPIAEAVYTTLDGGGGALREG